MVRIAPRVAALGASAVWLLLQPLAVAAAGEGRPQVFLNHFSVVVDPATAHDISTNAYLKETFASVFEKANVSNDGKRWTGTYLYGERTYLELYEASPAQGDPGASAIALGVEKPGDIARLVLPLAEQTGGEALVVLRTVQGPKGGQVPWFYQLRVNYRGEALPNTGRWVMEYQKDFLRTVLPGKDGITRAQLAARFQEKGRLTKDITGATVALSEKEMEHLLAELAVYGWSVRTEGTTRLASGPAMTLTLVAATPGSKGVVEVRFQLARKPSQAQSVHFGPKSVLSVREDGTAVWTF